MLTSFSSACDIGVPGWECRRDGAERAERCDRAERSDPARDAACLSAGGGLQKQASSSCKFASAQPDSASFQAQQRSSGDVSAARLRCAAVINIYIYKIYIFKKKI